MNIELSKLPKTLCMRVPDEEDVGTAQGALTLVILDQRQLPRAMAFLEIEDWKDAIMAIKDMAVRGAPAIGIAGAAAMCLRSHELAANGIDAASFLAQMQDAAKAVGSARPTAVSLSKAVRRCMDATISGIESGDSPAQVAEELLGLVDLMISEDIDRNRKMGSFGADLLDGPSKVVTHCNAGSLATAFFGTALGVVYEAAERGLIEMVFADETRPLGQGSRLTAWELSRAGIPVTLICDDMTASVMSSERIDAVFVGADRIASNGDVANKIGTLSVAILAKHFGVPFYVVAPVETIDFGIADGSQIPIEQRDASEVTEDAIDGVNIMNPSFDVTPAELVTRIVTERGAFLPTQLGLLRP